MRNIFKRRRPTHRVEPVKLGLEDLLVARWWGYTPEQWAKLPALVKVDKREGWFCARGLS